MKIFLWTLAILALVAIIPVATIIINMMFISEITQGKLKLSPEFMILHEGVDVAEIAHEDPPLPREPYKQDNPDGGREMLLHEDGSISEGRRVFEEDPGEEVIVAFNRFRNDAYVFRVRDNEVYQYADGYKGKKIGSFADPAFSYTGYILPVNERYFIVHGDMAHSPYRESELWQVEYETLNKTLLGREPYYSFVRPPRVFVFEEPAEQVVVYYTGSFNFAFGGDSSRPKFSVLRMYNHQYPEGRDIVQFGFKAGTVVDVRKTEYGYLVIADPSLPAMADKPRVPPRKWKLLVK